MHSLYFIHLALSFFFFCTRLSPRLSCRQMASTLSRGSILHVAMRQKRILSPFSLRCIPFLSQLRITSRVLQHAASSFLCWMSIKYLPSFLSLPVTALKKCVSKLIFLITSIYTNPLIAKAGKTHSSDSRSCWPVGKNGSANCEMFETKIFIAVRCRAPLCPRYRGVVSQPILEKLKWKPNRRHQSTSFLTSDLRKRIITWQVLQMKRQAEDMECLLYFENRKLWSLGKRKTPKKKKKKNNKKCFWRL